MKRHGLVWFEWALMNLELYNNNQLYLKKKA